MDSPASTEDSSVTEETRDHWLIDFTGSNSGIDASASDSVNVIQGEDTFSTSSTDSSVRAMQLCRKENIDCLLCGHILLAADQGNYFHMLQVNRLARSAARGCDMHGEPLSFNAELSRRLNFAIRNTFEGSRPLDDLYIYISSRSVTEGIQGAVKVSYGGQNIYFQVRKQSDLMATQPLELLLNPSWINLNFIQSNLKTCQRNHGRDCEFSRYTRHIEGRPIYLIDTANYCLIKASDVETYLALSYVWGQSTTLKTMKSNLEELMEANSLISAKFCPSIPRTIVNAMELTRLLGKQFLWVDALCIIQDDDNSRHVQINQMAGIYANAILTIIAADGHDANYGLRGIKEFSHPQPRNIQQKVFAFVGGRSILPLYANSETDEDTGHLYGDSAYRKRCWTMQENLFSKRRVVFQRGKVYWHCNTHTGHEWDGIPSQIHLEDTRIENNLEDDIHVTKEAPSLSFYEIMVYEINSRLISIEADRLDAFAGVASVINLTLEGGFIGGLPEMFFDLALLWQPATSIARRRPPETHHQSCGPSTIHRLPSWSWIGWQGPITLKPWVNMSSRFTYSRDMVRDLPVVSSRCNWTIADEFDSTECQEVEVAWDRYYICAENQNSDLPDGWTRQRLEIDRNNDIMLKVDRLLTEQRGEKYIPPISWPSGPPNYFNYQGDKYSNYIHPLPVRESHEKMPIQRKSTFLRSRVDSTWLSIKVNFGLIGKDDTDLCHLLETGNEPWTGILKIHTDQDTQLVASSPTAHYRVQLVAISLFRLHRFYRRNICDALEESGHVNEILERFEDYEFYNVLWIGWEDGIAYRRGIGRVWRPVWERQKLEQIDLVLG